MSESKPAEDQSIVTRDVARDYILKFLISSEYLLPGDRMNLPFFAKRLNCSVTPIREAFAQLSHSGLIKVVPKRGFHIAAFGEKEARQLLHAIIGLESQAIRAAAAGQLNLRSLANANESIRNANTPAERFFAGVGFHQELASFFDGTHLSNLLFEMKVRLYFYMKTYLSTDEHTQQIVGTHRRIIRCLESGDQEGAILALRQKWLDVKLSF